MRTPLFVFFFLLLHSDSFCQSIVGVVQDEGSVGLIGATVVVLDKVDSTMLAFGVTNDDGNFEIYDVSEGDHLLQVSYTGYSDMMIPFSKGAEKKTLEAITMSLSTELLEEVSIKEEHIPMGILGDTINYNAAAFQTRPGASVEDLLKRLPGIEVARDGSIKAQGEDVENVLVDGKEFFSGDPTIATRNLEAEAVEKVQVYDKQSDEAEFTGVEDGNEEKTINLKLKEGYKSGGFGKVEAHGGSEDTKMAKVNYNRFSSSVQASIIANTNNINEQAFSFNDYMEFMGGFQNMIAAGGFSEYNSMAPNQGNAKGINDQNSIGTNINFSKSKKLKLNMNYLYAGSDRTINEVGNTETFGENINFLLQDTTSITNATYNHRLNTKLKLNPSPNTNLVWNNKFFGLVDNQIRNSKSQFLQANEVTNTTSNDFDLESNSLSFNSKLIYRRKFSKKGRNMMLSTGYEHLDRDESLDLLSSLSLFSLLVETNQLQNFNNKQQIINANLNFTEPIGNKLYLDANYGFLDKSENPEREYLDRLAGRIIRDDNLSGSFIKEWTTHNMGFAIKRNRKKLKLNSGLNMKYIFLKAFDEEISLSDIDRLYLLPFGSAHWSLKGTKRVEFNYNTDIKEPSIGQMVNQVNNSNPNLIRIGNASLVPEYTHTVNLSYNYFDSFNFSSFLWNLSTVFSPNKIVNTRSFIDVVVTELKPINSSAFSAISGYLHYSTPIRKLKMKLRIDNQVNYSQYNTFVQDVETTFSNGQLSTKLTLENKNKDIFDIAAGIDLSLSAFSSDVNSNFNDPFFNYDLFVDGYVNLGGGWDVSSKYDLHTYNSAFFDDGIAINLLQASIQKSFLSEKLIVKLTSFDLLNQNIGVDRSGSVSTLSNNRYNTLGRYFLIGASYRIGVKKKSGVDFIAS